MNPPKKSATLLGNGSTTIGSYEALGGQQKQRHDLSLLERTTEDNPDASLGFADGYNSWSNSLQAFHHAIYHTIVYIVIGIAGYSFILETKWSVIDSVYFSAVVFTTVGYGDISPDSSDAGMIFTIFYALYGIVILGIFLGILGDMAVERQQNLKQASLERTRKEYLTNMIAAESHHEIEEVTEEADKPFFLSIYQIVKEQIRNVIVLIILGIPIIILEKWSAVKGIYWLIVTGTTIGLGDAHPENPWSKAICIIYIPLVVAFGGSFLGMIATSYVDKRNDATEAQFFTRAVTHSDLAQMDIDQSGEVTKDEFLVYMLLTLQKVDKSDIEEILNLFCKLDKDGSGSLTANDIEFISHQTVKLRRNSISKYSSRRKAAQLI